MAKSTDDSAADDSAAEDSAFDDSAAEASTSDEDSVDEDSSDDDASENAVSDPPAADGSASDASTLDETMLYDPPAEGPTSHKTAAEGPTSQTRPAGGRAPRASAPDDALAGTVHTDRTVADAPPAGGSSERRLAAILFADVAGYTALSSHDEDLALALIKSFQKVSRKIVSEKGGRVVKFLGDGMLGEFSSLDAAVNAAHALQNSFPYIEEVEEARVSLRVGVHLGDIVFGEDGDVYGSGVNVASRIEGHAPLAGVVVSDSAYQQLRHRRHYQFSSIGEKDLKGVPDPMELYVVLLAGQEAPAPALRVPTKAAAPPKAAKGGLKKRWVALGLIVVAGSVAFGLDLGGVQGRANQLLQDLGFGDALTGGVFAETPQGTRTIDGGAAVDGAITVEFTGLINLETATGNSVQLLGPGEAIVPAEVSASASASGDASVIEITPRTPLEYATSYRVRFTEALRSGTGGAIRPPRGEGLPEDLMSFVTQPVPPDPPVLASSAPEDGSTGANGASPVVATFSKPMNAQTLDSTTVILRATASGVQVPAALTCCGADDGTLQVDPVRPLANGLYELVLADGITDADGLPLAPVTFGFRVGVVAQRRVPTGPGRLTVQVVPDALAPYTIVVIDGTRWARRPSRGGKFRRELPTGWRFSARPSSRLGPSVFTTRPRR